MINTNIYLAIIGYGTTCSDQNIELAKEVGAIAAKNHISLVAGNVSATFGYAFKAALEYSVNTICVIEKHVNLPEKHDALEVIWAKDTFDKHHQISEIGDAAIVIGGGTGSKILLQHFLKAHKTVIVIEGTGGLADSDLPKEVLKAKNTKEAFEILNTLKNNFIFKSGLGNIQLSYDHFALCKLALLQGDNDLNCPSDDPFKLQLERYFNLELKEFEGKFHLKGTDFQLQVWEALLDIPYGKTQEYGELAQSIGNRKASRPVGAAAGKNPIWIMVPCHRLIGQKGKLTGYAGGLKMKQHLLDLENHQMELF